MEEIEQRLKDTTAVCIASYEAWNKDKKNEEARENLAEAIHELRKVSSRLEIEMAASEREQITGRPISIPPHRSQRKVHGGGDAGFGDEEDDDVGNMMPDSNEGNGLQPQRRNNSNGGGGKRPMNRGRRPNPNQNRGNE